VTPARLPHDLGTGLPLISTTRRTWNEPSASTIVRLCRLRCQAAVSAAIANMIRAFCFLPCRSSRESGTQFS